MSGNIENPNATSRRTGGYTEEPPEHQSTAASWSRLATSDGDSPESRKTADWTLSAGEDFLEFNGPLGRFGDKRLRDTRPESAEADDSETEPGKASNKRRASPDLTIYAIDFDSGDSDFSILEDLRRKRRQPADVGGQPDRARRIPKDSPSDSDRPGSPSDEIRPSDSRPDDTDEVVRRADGKIEQIRYPDGRARSFDYGADGELSRINYRDADGEKVFNKKSDGKWYYTVANIDLPLDMQCNLDQGTGDFKMATGNRRQWQIEKPDGSRLQERIQVADRKPDRRPETPESPDRTRETDRVIGSDSVEDARAGLIAEMRQHLEQPRLERLDEMMDAFEQRMDNRAYLRRLAGVKGDSEIQEDVEGTVVRTYDNLRQMVADPDGGTFYDQKTRAFLAENFLFHAQDPTTSDQGPSGGRDQGGHGTCWIQAGHIWGMTQRTDQMADLLKQVSLTGKYTTKNGGEQWDGPKTFTFSRDYLKFPEGWQETTWSISKATDQWHREPHLITKVDGHRSPVGKIFDYVLPVLGGRQQNPGKMDGGVYRSFLAGYIGRQYWYAGSGEILDMVTEDKPCFYDNSSKSEDTVLVNDDLRTSLLEKGSVINLKGINHARSLHLKQVGDQWCVIQDDQHGELKDRIIERIHDIESWARGDRNASRQVSEAMTHRRFKLASDYTLAGTIEVTPDSKELHRGLSYQSSTY